MVNLVLKSRAFSLSVFAVLAVAALVALFVTSESIEFPEHALALALFMPTILI